MTKKPNPLSLAQMPTGSKDISAPSPASPRSPLTPSRQFNSNEGMPQQRSMTTASLAPSSSDSSLPLAPVRPTAEMRYSPTTSSLPTFAGTGEGSYGAQSEQRGFFKSYKASLSSSRLQSQENNTVRQVSSSDLNPNGSQPQAPSQNKKLGSTPELSRFATPEDGHHPKTIPRRPVGASSGPEASMDVRGQPYGGPKKMKQRPFAHLLNRTRSTRVDAGEQSPRVPRALRTAAIAEHPIPDEEEDSHERHLGMKTAPLDHARDKSFRDMMSSAVRNRSADRHLATDPDNRSVSSSRESGKNHHSSFASSFRESSGGALLSNLKSSSTKAADGIGKAGKGIFGKITKGTGVGGPPEPTPVSDEQYVCRVISLPLVQQTRRTRISKRLEDSKDKTEFWMPALPWRCIDYLNSKGCEEEGLYRIPGSGPRVKEWQRRFDTELDIDLFEEPDLYDINIIGSMFKAWLRELPDEIFPKATQARIADECMGMGSQECPQMLKDELSKLPPFNYYLLFAITCHLCLLHSYVDKNKMDYRNLCICFQPCLKIDGFCFQYLVCDWKNCWQGCWTEKEALAAEGQAYEADPTLAPVAAPAPTLSPRPPPSIGANSTTEKSQALPAEDHKNSSSGNSQPAPKPEGREGKQRPPPLKMTGLRRRDRGGSGSISVLSSPASSHSQLGTPVRPSPGIEHEPQQLPPLSPMKPLSPLKF